MPNIVQESNVVNYVSELKKILVNRNNQPVVQKLKIDYRTGDNYSFSIINAINQIVSPNGYDYEMFLSFINTRKELILLAYQNNYAIQDGVISFHLDTYTENFLNYIKTYDTEVQVTIVRKSGNTTEVVLRDNALAEPRPYIEGQTPTIITVQTIYTGSPTVSGSFSAGSDNILVEEVNNFAFGDNLTNTSELQFTIGQWNEPDATKLFAIGNGTSSTPKTIFSVDGDGNIACGNISGDVLYLGGEQFSLSGIDEKFVATSAWVNNTFETKVDATASYNSLQNEITAVDNKFSGYATKQELPTKISDLTNDSDFATTGYVDAAIEAATSGTGDLYETKVDANSKFNYLSGQISETNDNIYQNYALKSEVPTRVSQLENDEDYASKTYVGEKNQEVLGYVGNNYTTNATFNSSVSNLSGAVSNLNNTLTSNYAPISTLPTQISELENDVGYITGVNLDPYALKTELPTKVSELENDVGYVTSSQIEPSRLTNKKSALIDRDVKEYNFRIHYQENIEVFVNWQDTLSGVLYISPVDRFDLEEGKQIEFEQFVKPVGEFNAVSGNGVQIADLPDTFGEDKILVFKRFITNDNGVYKQFAKFEFEYSNEDVEQLIHEPLTFIALEDDTKIAFTLDQFSGYVGHQPTVIGAIQYAINEGEWQDYTLNTQIELNQGDQVSFQAISGTYTNDANYFFLHFTSSRGRFNVEGSLNSLRGSKERNSFEGLTGLVDASKLELRNTLPAYDNQYYALFKGCTSLTSVPKLPATTLKSGCYYYMFAFCTSLQYVPKDLLPATTLANYCYSKMFEGCSSLKNVPRLPATGLVSACYEYMFYGCTSLTEVPEDLLPATTLAQQCYAYMFQYCASLRKAPKLPATTVAYQCYYSMFYGCSSLDEIDCALTAWTGATAPTQNWLNGVAANGTFKKTTSLPVVRGNSNIPSGWLVENEDDLNFIAHGSVQIELKKTGSPDAIDLHYSTDGETFQVYNIGDVITLSAGQVLSMYNTTNDFSHGENDNYYNFSMSGTGWVEVEGHVNALVNHSTASIVCKYSHLFYGCTRLFDASKLSFEGDKPSYAACYFMFQNCTNLLYVPEKIYTTSATVCNRLYCGMFQGCTSITNVPEDYLPAVVCNGGYDYAQMFYNCTSLKNVPRLPATTLANYCYSKMFEGCSSLEYVPEDLLPATTLANYCYSKMFEGCSSLKNVPRLPATTLANNCYQNMFHGCNSLSSVPKKLLSAANTIPTYGYGSMFRNCTALKQAPELPATNLNTTSYTWMFNGCSNLTSAPDLPAKTLANDCYREMFSYCRALTDSPHIAATGLVSACCQNMFYNCSKLSSINVGFAEWNDLENATYNWVSGVAASGIFRKPASLNRVEGPSNIPQGWQKIDNDGVTFICKDAPVEIALVQVGSPSAITMFYSVNGNDLESYSVGTVVSLQPGETLTFKGTSENFCQNVNHRYRFTFTGDGKVDVEGKLMGLVNNIETPGTAMFYNVFSTNSHVRDLSRLVFPDKVDSVCYQNMFYENTALTALPKLPAKTLAATCYSQMFKRCYALSSISEDYLPATTLANGCYEYMFQNCTSLTSVPRLPATTLANQCYASMFQGCTSLSTVPQDLLPAITMTVNCYVAMFQGCTSLTNVLELPATTLALACYQNMFNGCSSLSSIPEDYLPATTMAQNCYYGMFHDCTSLTNACNLPATELATNCYYWMFYNCPNLSGDIVLPATKLATLACNRMFHGTKITSIVLPAKLLISQCYVNMFINCTSLSSITVGFTLWDEDEGCTTNWLNGASATGNFYCPTSLDNTIRDESHIPSGWTINPASTRGGQSKGGSKKKGGDDIPDYEEEEIIEEQIPPYDKQQRYTEFKDDENSDHLTGKVLGPFEPDPIEEEDGEGEEEPIEQPKKEQLKK